MKVKILKGTFISILVFFSISFFSVLLQLNSPINRQSNSNLDIGFPFIYYSQFIVDNPIPNSGWKLKFLLIDCLITWLVITGSYLILKKNKKFNLN
jgi:hypothetical protein